jgi:hypothetical protein
VSAVPAGQARGARREVAATGGDDSTCAVCLEEPAPGELVRRLRCMHAFHVDCIDKWLEGSRVCPVCKMTVGVGET